MKLKLRCIWEFRGHFVIMKVNYIAPLQHLEIRDLKACSSRDCVLHHKFRQKKLEIKIRMKGSKSSSLNIQKASSSSCVQSFRLWGCFDEITMSASIRSSSLKRSFFNWVLAIKENLRNFGNIALDYNLLRFS